MTSLSQATLPAAADYDQPYKLVSITRAPSLAEEDGREWYCYVIMQNNNKIVGHRPGSLEAVRLAAEDLVVRANERRIVHSGRKHLTIGTRKKT
ncbi:MAG: hypothetical protein ACREYE_21405 [Gammaproteobacteria bacterium]